MHKYMYVYICSTQEIGVRIQRNPLFNTFGIKFCLSQSIWELPDEICLATGIQLTHLCRNQAMVGVTSLTFLTVFCVQHNCLLLTQDDSAHHLCIVLHAVHCSVLLTH